MILKLAISFASGTPYCAADSSYEAVTANSPERRNVTLGAERDGLRDVLSGVQPGESVIVKPPAGLHDGDRVRARPGA